MAQAKPYGYIFIIALVLIVILAGPSFFKAGTQTYSDFWRDFWAPFTDWGDTDGEGGDGFAGVGYKIYYTDGSTKDFTPTELSMIPLIISDGGKEVAKLEVIFAIQCAWNGNYSYWSATANVKTELLGEVVSSYENLKYDATKNGDLENDVLKYVTAGYISASDINDHLLVNQKGSGDYNLRTSLFDTTFSITLNGNVHTESGISSHCDWTFHYSVEGIESLSFEIYTVPIYV